MVRIIRTRCTDWNGVLISGTIGYGRFGGTRTTAQDLTVIFETMDANKLLSQDRLLTGTFVKPLPASYAHVPSRLYPRSRGPICYLEVGEAHEGEESKDDVPSRS